MINGIVMLPNLVLALIVFFVFYSPQGGSNYWLNALPQASSPPEFRDGARTFVPGNCHFSRSICRVIHRHTDIQGGDLVQLLASAVWQLVSFRDILQTF